MRTPVRALLSGALVITALTPVAASAASSAAADSYIVTLRTGDPGEVSGKHAQKYGASVDHVYKHALRGYAARMSRAAAARLAADPSVASVVVDREVHLTAPDAAGKGGPKVPAPAPQPPQQVPTGIARIGGAASSAAAGNGSGTVNANVAILDTGIIANHPDLTVAGGYNCTRAKGWADQNGHGTHVAGTVAARDNGIGVVGVAPGANLWSVRVLDRNGSGAWSTIICGIDWVAANASLIDVANMSLGGAGSATGCNDGGLHQAICNAVAAGVPFAVAAGNESSDAARSVPAAYPQVITVSAIADSDGLAGGLGGPLCYSDLDDTLSNFSNFGTAVDIAAPGSCIRSTSMSGGYESMSGTSMAAPHVTGAAALYLSTHRAATPAEVRTALSNAGTANWSGADDPDGIHEPLLNVAGF